MATSSIGVAGRSAHHHSFLSSRLGIDKAKYFAQMGSREKYDSTAVSNEPDEVYTIFCERNE